MKRFCTLRLASLAVVGLATLLGIQSSSKSLSELEARKAAADQKEVRQASQVESLMAEWKQVTGG